MANDWSTFKLGGLFPDSAKQLATGVSSLMDSLNAVLTLTKTALTLSEQLATSAATSPVEATLRATISELNDFIDDLAGNTTAHAILVPIQKQFFGIGVQPQEDDTVSLELTPTFDDLLQENAFFRQLVDDITPDTVSFINSAPTAIGGNKGFWKALALSLQDEGDLARPDFDSDFAVAGVAVVFGAQTLADLQPHFDVLNQVVNTGNRSDLSSRTRPVAQNVRVHAVPINATGNIGVQIDWDPVPPTSNFPLFSPEQLIATEIFIVRSTDSSFREQPAWNQTFSRQPRDSANDLQSENNAQVVARLRNDGLVTRYIDDDADLIAGQAYYYGVAIRYTIEGKTQSMGNFSAVRQARYTARPQNTRKAEPPDWWATPSLIQLFPALEGLLNQVRLAIAALDSKSTSNSGLQAIIRQTVRQIDTLINQGETIAATLTAINTKLISLLTTPLGATSATVITVNSGGMDGWLGELASRLTATEDPSRPPFDNSELVGGLVIVAGAPNLPTLQPFVDLLTLFFGSSGSSEDNALITALDTIDNTLALNTEITLSAGLTPVRTPSDDIVPETAPRTVFDESMFPEETVDCD